MIPKEVVAKERTVLQVTEWQLDHDCESKALAKKGSMVDGQGVTYTHYYKDSNGYQYDRLFFSFPWKSRGKTLSAVRIYPEETCYLLKSLDEDTQYCYHAREFKELFISTDELPKHEISIKSNNILKSCVNSLYTQNLYRSAQKSNTKDLLFEMARQCSSTATLLLDIYQTDLLKKNNLSEQLLIEEVSHLMLLTNLIVHKLGEDEVEAAVRERIREYLEKNPL